MAKKYAGIGSRKTPNGILGIMTDLGNKLALSKCLLRSGGAKGADQAFEAGCNKVDDITKKHHFKEVYYVDSFIKGGERLFYTDIQIKEASLIAASLHPFWKRLSPYVQSLHMRNVFQIMGINLLEPVDFVLCWTPDGAKTGEQTSRITGGTGQAIRIASHYGIKVYNLENSEDFELALTWLNK